MELIYKKQIEETIKRNWKTINIFGRQISMITLIITLLAVTGLAVGSVYLGTIIITATMGEPLSPLGTETLAFGTVYPNGHYTKSIYINNTSPNTQNETLSIISTTNPNNVSYTLSYPQLSVIPANAVNYAIIVGMNTSGGSATGDFSIIMNKTRVD